MEIISNSAEHHFFTKLDALEIQPEGWYCLYFSLSRFVSHQDLCARPKNILPALAETKARRDAFVGHFEEICGSGIEGLVYLFSDFDVLLLCKASDENTVSRVMDIYRKLAGLVPKGFSDMNPLKGSSMAQHKLADQKLLGAVLHASYQAMRDGNKVSSIGVRRKRRDAPLVMIVEDDRFTAHYASTIISKEYEFVLCRTAEESIAAYIEHAPDIVFMDIHLPGISGHEALEAIYSVDPEAYVVMLSVDTVKDNVIKASKSGARLFLKKPFSKERLIEAVRNSPYVRARMR